MVYIAEVFTLKKLIIAILCVSLMLSITACSIGGIIPTTDDNDVIKTSEVIESILDDDKSNEDDKKDDDPCKCCPDCDQEECECLECGENKDCECAMPGGGGGSESFTFLVEFYAYVAGWRPIHKTYGEATVIIESADGILFFGSAPGAGEYTEELIPETGQVETTFEFTVVLKDFDPRVGDSITVGLDRIGAEEVTNYARSDPKDKITLPDMGNVILMILGQEYFDPETEFFYFTVPLEKDGTGYALFTLERVSADFEGHVELSIHIKRLS